MQRYSVKCTYFIILDAWVLHCRFVGACMCGCGRGRMFVRACVLCVCVCVCVCARARRECVRLHMDVPYYLN